MRSLLISLLALLVGCSTAYRSLIPVQENTRCIQQFKPHFRSELYTTRVDVAGKHLSGLLLFKTLPDSSLRVVFMNEAGVTFFDFEFAADGNFKPHHVIHALDKKPVIQTLRKDIELIAMLKVGRESPIVYSQGNELFHAFPSGQETDYMITDGNCLSLLRLEKGTKRKKKADVRFFGAGQPADSVFLRHYNFNMTISLKKLSRE